MKAPITKTFILITACLISLTAKAQQDYVITTNGDSIICKVSTPFMGTPKYKIEGTGESKKIRPEEVKEYFIARRKALFRSVININSGPFTEKGPLFMPLIEKGKINLYKMVYTTTNYNGTVSSSSSTTVWYISKGTDSVSELKTTGIFSIKSKKSRKDDFLDMIKDNKEVYDKYLADDKFSFKEIRNLVHLYNTGVLYKDPDSDVTEKKEDTSNGFNPNQN